MLFVNLSDNYCLTLFPAESLSCYQCGRHFFSHSCSSANDADQSDFKECPSADHKYCVHERDSVQSSHGEWLITKKFDFGTGGPAQLLSAHAIGARGLRFKSRASQIGAVSPTACHRGDVSSELCSPGDKLRRWAPPLVKSFGVIPRV